MGIWTNSSLIRIPQPEKPLPPYSTANVYGNADTTLVQVMRVWQSVRTVCVPGVTTYHGANHQQEQAISEEGCSR